MFQGLDRDYWPHGNCGIGFEQCFSGLAGGVEVATFGNHLGVGFPLSFHYRYLHNATFLLVFY